MEQQLEYFKKLYIQHINGNLSDKDYYLFLRNLEKEYRRIKQQIIKFLSFKTNGIEIEEYIESPDKNKFDILFEYFYFGMCPSLLPNPNESFISHYFMWVKKDDIRVINKFQIKDDIYTAIRTENITGIKNFIDKGFDDDDDELKDVYRKLLYLNNYDLIKYFIENTNIKIDEAFNKYLRYNKKFNINDELIDLFIEKGLNIDIMLSIIINNGKTHFIEYFLKKGADLNTVNEALKKNNKTVLMMSITSGNIDTVKYIINKDFPITNLDLEIAKPYPNILKYLQSLSKKPYKRVNGECNMDDVSDVDIQNIAEKINIKINEIDGKLQNRQTLCQDIVNYFKTAAEYMAKNVEKCITESTLSGDVIGDIHPLFFTMYQQGKHTHCGDIRELVMYPHNPYTMIPFTNEQKNTFNKKMEILKSFIDKLEDEDEGQIVMTTSGLIKNATLNFTSLLRYANPIDLYVNASEEIITEFIGQLSSIGILSNSDVNSLKSSVNLNTKKIALANVLENKLTNAIDINYINGVGISSVSVTLEEIYNNIFKNDNDNVNLMQNLNIN